MSVKETLLAMKRAYFIRIWEDSEQTRRGRNKWLGSFMLLGDDESIAEFLRQHGRPNPNACLIGCQ